MIGKEEQDPLRLFFSLKNNLPHYRSTIEHRTCPRQALHKKVFCRKEECDHRNENGVIITRKPNHSSGLNA